MPDPSSSTLTVLNSNSYSSEEGVVAGHSGQFTPGGYLSTVKHTALAGIEPATFRLLVRRPTSCATETTIDTRRINYVHKIIWRLHTTLCFWVEFCRLLFNEFERVTERHDICRSGGGWRGGAEDASLLSVWWHGEHSQQHGKHWRRYCTSTRLTSL